MKKETDKKFMMQAIAKAKQGVKKGQTPFGACIIKDGRVIACEHNTVFKTMDITAHAEVHAIRVACKKLKTIDLAGCTIYSTCEPCPMCFSACHWARIGRIVYGAKISDAKRFGFNELSISNIQMKEYDKSPLKITSGFLREENIKLFQFWNKRKNKRSY